MVLLNSPSKCPVLFPSLSVSYVKKLESEDTPWVETRNWYIDIDASNATVIPEKYFKSLFLIADWACYLIKSISLWIPILLAPTIYYNTSYKLFIVSLLKLKVLETLYVIYKRYSYKYTKVK